MKPKTLALKCVNLHQGEDNRVYIDTSHWFKLTELKKLRDHLNLWIEYLERK
jgi:hypothetical protein